MNDLKPAGDDAALLLEFLCGRDVPCPRCGYNLRDLSESRCPECREQLALAVGFHTPRFGWFLATVTPGLFSVICAGFLLLPIVIAPWAGGGAPPWQFFAADAFGWTSGVAAFLLIHRRHAFVQQPDARQRTWAIASWTIHVGAFAVLVALVWLWG